MATTHSYKGFSTAPPLSQLKEADFWAWARPYLALAKARMTFFILFSVSVGFLFAGGALLEWDHLWVLLGSTLLCVSCFSLNQVLEVEEDKQMMRTCRRPLPLNQLSKTQAWFFGVSNGLFGTLVLLLLVNTWSAAIGLAIVLLYGFIYTPSKKITTLNTLIGAIPGALPPLLGWVAYHNSLGFGGLFLFALLFFWQIPHFLAIAYLYQEDYRKGGFVMLSLLDPTGLRCAWHILLNTSLLWAVSFFPFFTISFEKPWLYLLGAFVTGLGFFTSALFFLMQRNPVRARMVFFTSLFYLPLIYAFLILSN